jgi:antitoxin HicB
MKRTQNKSIKKRTVTAPSAGGILSYTVQFQPEPEGGYTVIVPALRGCVTYGRTFKEAQKFALEAMTGYIEVLKKYNEPIPIESSILSTVMTLDTRAYA